MRKYLLTIIALLAVLFASCSDEIEQVTVQRTPQVLTRAGYDEGAFQWDNVPSGWNPRG